MLETDFDPDDRELCDDGACTGVIGADGRCKECGRPRGGKASAVIGASPHLSDADQLAETDGEFDPDRRLCPDGACTGLIGPDGRCKICGAAAAP